ncbi:methionyl-tRNA formyltransferase [Halorarius litoreus]|uniref:methionyl-tRNA formyltransferase n=1 Tax=Halorarius litoreus TaxID=2962676 RepID=UPI0020CDDC42|nr:formyltransferase family protein [Halorarius litoreus]
MRTLLVTSEEPLYLPRYLEPVVSEHAASIEAVVVAPLPRSTREQVRRQYRMFGPLAFVRMGARFVAGRLADVLSGGRPVGGRYHSVASLARAHDVPVWHAPDVSAPTFVDRVRAADPDLLLSVVAGQKLGPDLLAVPDDAVNLHGSLLPKYRGRATAFWPLYYGDDVTGVTAHRLTDEWDAGPIVERRRVQIADEETVHSLYLKLADCGGRLACDLLDRYPCALETEPNETTDGDYHSLPTPAQRRAFLDRGGRFA